MLAKRTKCRTFKPECRRSSPSPTSDIRHRTSDISPFRRGSVYILVLGASTMVAVVGIGAVALARSSVRATTAAADWSEAGFAAQSGIDYIVAVMNATPTWRTDLKNNTVYGPFSVGRAKIAITLIDEGDADFSDDASEPVRAYAVATVGGATRTYSALIEPASNTGLDLLRCPLAAAGDITISGNATATLGPISSNGKLTNSATLTSDIETVSISSTGFIAGYVQTGVAAKSMPSNAIITRMSAVATAIPYGSISGGTIDRAVLTPTLNTISTTTNAQGVYSISVPLLSTLKIRRSRIQASLVITMGATSQLIILDENLWDPAAANLPALVVQGSLLGSVTFGGSSTSASLSEAATGTNYNPAGAPYNSVVDSDTLDTYPCELHGIYHIDGAIPLTINNNLKSVGCIIAGGSVTLNTPAQLAANPTFLAAPPSGYADGANTKMRIAQSSYRWEVSNVNPATP